ncbi:MAG: tetratricopeptide repeat protein [Candidatus Ozemobacteraceae bacterium]
MKRCFSLLLCCCLSLPCVGQTNASSARTPEINMEALKPLAEKGDPMALAGMGDAFFSGFGTPQNLPEALKYYLLASEKGQLSVAYSLAKMFKSGKGTSPDPEKAFFWTIVALQSPCSEAVKRELLEIQKGLTTDLQKGKQEKVLKEAQDWYKQKSLPEKFAPEESLQKKADEILKNAETGNAFAQYQTGNLVLMGFGFPRDYAKAAEWYKKSAEQGYCEAQISLGLLFNQGLGVSKNPSEAYFWLKKGLADAKIKGTVWEKFQNFPEQISLFLNDEELKIVEKRLQEWKPTK